MVFTRKGKSGGGGFRIICAFLVLRKREEEGKVLVKKIMPLMRLETSRASFG